MLKGKIKRCLSLLLALSIIVLFSTSFVFTEPVRAATLYYVSRNGNNSNGASWANAWNELNQINWSIIQPGDTIYLDGGSTSMTYNTPLVIGKSGTSGNPITIKLSTESGRNGQAIFYGGRSTLLPEGGAHPASWTLPTDQPGRTNLSGIDYNGYNYIVIDGTKWNGIDIHGCNSHGVNLQGHNDTLNCVTVYDCGGWGQSQEQIYDGAPQNPGIRLAGNNNTVSYCIIHDNGEDGIQNGWIWETQTAVECSNFTVYRSWIYNSRKHSTYDGPFNWAMHADCIQYWAPVANTGIKVQDCIMGPGCPIILGEGTCTVSNVNFTNSIFVGWNTTAGIQMTQGVANGSSNWTWDHCTIAGSALAAYTPIEYTGSSPAVKNCLLTGFRHVAFTNANPTVSNNYLYGMDHYTAGPTESMTMGTVADPQYVNGTFAHVGGTGWNTFDFTPQNSAIISAGAGSSIHSVNDLMNLSPSGSATNLLTNGDAENGTTGWTASGCTLTSTTSQYHSGTKSISVTGRAASWNGPYQDITSETINGRTYNSNEVWVKTASGTANVCITVALTAASTTYISTSYVACNSTSWTKISGPLTLSWDGTLTNATWYIETQTGTASFYFDDARFSEASNLLTNGDTEGGTTGWTASGCTLASTTSQYHSGTKSISVTARAASWNGPQQDITSKVENGKTYNAEVWVKTASGTANVTITVALTAGGTTDYPNSGYVTCNSTGWTKVSGPVTLNWSGTLTSAVFYLETQTGTASFYFDDAVFVK